MLLCVLRCRFILWGLVGAMLAVPLTSVLRIITSDLMQSGAGGPYVALLSSLLEGRPLDVALPGVDPTPEVHLRPGPVGSIYHEEEVVSLSRSQAGSSKHA